MAISVEDAKKRYNLTVEDVDDNHIRYKIGENGDWIVKENFCTVDWIKFEAPDPYVLYSNGDLLNLKKHKIKYGTYIKSRDHYCFNLVDNQGKYRHVNVINILYTNFIGEIPEGCSLYCIDGDIKNTILKNISVKPNGTRRGEIDESFITNAVQIKNFPNYYINLNQEIYSVKRQEILKPYKGCMGYLTVCLANTEGKTNLLLHRLMYQTFIGDLDDNLVIDHINQNKLDNNINNLRQTTRSENNLNVDRDKSYIYQYRINNFGNIDFVNIYDTIDDIIKKYPDFKGIQINFSTQSEKHEFYQYFWSNERWELTIENEEELIEYRDLQTCDGSTFINNQYIINKSGKIVRKHNLTVLHPTFKETYFHASLFNDDGKQISYPIHRLVAFTYHRLQYLEISKKFKNPMVNHIDEDKINNYCDNLEWIDVKGNTVHSMGKKTCQIDIDNLKIIAIHNCYDEASRSVGMISIGQSIKLACIEKYCIHGYLWKFYNSGDKVGDILRMGDDGEFKTIVDGVTLEPPNFRGNPKPNRGIKICQIDMATCKIIFIFASYAKLAKFIGKSHPEVHGKIRKACENKTEEYGYMWKIADKDDFIGKYINFNENITTF
jgi:hypothetical protein